MTDKTPAEYAAMDAGDILVLLQSLLSKEADAAGKALLQTAETAMQKFLSAKMNPSQPVVAPPADILTGPMSVLKSFLASQRG